MRTIQLKVHRNKRHNHLSQKLVPAVYASRSILITYPNDIWFGWYGWYGETARFEVSRTKILVLLGCDAVKYFGWKPTFWRTVLPPS